MPKKLAAVLLAAGHGTRMQSKKPKILLAVGGKSMVQHIYEALEAVVDLPLVVVVGAGDQAVRRQLGPHARYVVQDERLGTGHATLMARAELQGQSGQVIVTYGDMPLLRAASLRRLAQAQADTGAAVALLSSLGDAASTFGRIVREQDEAGRGRLLEIVEVAQARRRPNAAELLAIREHNTGVYCFEADWLWDNLERLPLRRARTGPEYYLTDMIALAVSQGRPVEAIMLEDADEGLGAGTRQELAVVEKAFRRRINRHWLDQGVTLVDPDTIYIDAGVTIGQDTVIWPNSYLQGRTVVGQDCVIGPNALLRNATLGDACVVEQAVVEDATLAAGTRAAPFSVTRGGL